MSLASLLTRFRRRRPVTPTDGPIPDPDPLSTGTILPTPRASISVSAAGIADSSSAGGGSGGAPAGPPIEPDDTREYMAGGNISTGNDYGALLARNVDDVTAAYGGDAIYELVASDPCVSSCLRVLRAGALADGITVGPAVEQDPGQPIESDPLAASAREVSDFVGWDLDNLDKPLDVVARSLLIGMMKFGCMLAELVWEYIEEGRYSGLIRIKAVKVKPRRSWLWVVDRYMNPVGIQARVPTGPPVVLPLAKFLVFTWEERDGDPRGSSACREPFNPWNAKVRSIPEHLKYLIRFGTPLTVGTMPEGSPREIPEKGMDGLPTGRMIPSEVAFNNYLMKASGGTNLVVPFGARVDIKQSQGTGQAFLNAFDWDDRQITLALLNQVKATLDAKYGARASSQVGQDIMGQIIKGLKRDVARMVLWQMIYNLVLVNYGTDRAARETPKLSLGDVEFQDLPNTVRSFATAGYALDPAHMPEIDQRIGLTPRVRERPQPAPQGATPGAGPVPSESGSDRGTQGG